MMSEQPGRQPFRFRLPWVVNQQPIPRQEPVEPQSRVPAQRPPFRPAGTAPSQPQAPPKTETPPPPSPPRTVTPSRVPSLPSSPSRRVPSQPQAPLNAESQPPPSPLRKQPGSTTPSPSRTTSQSRLGSRSPSISRATSQSRIGSTPPSPSVLDSRSKVPSQPPSPSRTKPSQSQTSPKRDSPSSSPFQRASQTEPPTQNTARPPSPIDSNSHQPIEVTSYPPSPLRRPYRAISPPPSPLRSTASQQEEPVQTKPILSQPKDKTYQPESEILFQPPFQPENRAQVQFAPVDPRNQPVLEKEIEENQDGKPKTIPEGTKEEKFVYSARAEQRQRRNRDFFDVPSGSDKPSKDMSNTTTQAEKYHLEKQTRMGEKEMPMRISKGGDTKVGGISPNKENWSNEPHPKSSTSVHREIRDDISRFVRKLAVQHPQEPTDESQISVITLAGENKGATMHLGVESGNKESSIKIQRGYKLNQEENEVTTDGESSSRGKRLNNSKTTEEQENAAYINSNVQTINNSIMSNSSFSASSPGVHFVFSRRLTQPTESNKEPESLESYRSNSSVTQSQKLTYDPIIKRRCLRGLLLESSDSDPDNPEKPRRHGCRYTCQEKNKGGVDEIENSLANNK
ncbi:hypothetical protein GIB67_042808 [Kingdonia uniflora]|uniref:Uncharacterized protein n=1 Tax=Kingdonia uniflora TaxID=39325 RepID=A0A7J7L140_9MAGN|nr:hypothetical protein GIB67_042808 [Kingdonia uniflora]